ncbi:DUF2165 family protein [Tistlia consotensis]|nr:DUF2165 domain-containing protein [Tistlia consotensis]
MSGGRAGLQRWAALLVLGGIALHMTLAVLGNITDYGTNWQFVQHVLSMDTTFKSPALMWRAVTDPTLQSLAYLAIIAAELLAAALLWAGWLRLWRARRGETEAFQAAKGLALFALAWAFSIWVAGFIAVGGEWFAMWQSASWNGQDGATRFATVTGFALLFVALRE